MKVIHVITFLLSTLLIAHTFLTACPTAYGLSLKHANQEQERQPKNQTVTLNLDNETDEEEEEV